MSNKTVTPELRFPGFSGEWEVKPLSQLAKIVAGQSPNGQNYNDVGHGMPFYQGKTDFGEIYLEEPTKWTSQVTKVADQDDILMSVRAPVGALNVTTQEICIGRGLAAIKPYTNRWFLYYSLLNIQKTITGNGGAIFDSINKEQIEKISIFTPPTPAEQKKIADCLTAVDDLITAETAQLDTLKDHKKGLMQNLFPTEGKTTPTLRFPGFDGAWEVKALGDYLDYQQPTPYLVSNTDYNDNYDTPVLTAGKTFILGHTNETHGVYEDGLPVIIFDDFTTASQFVNFAFKAKSSAMKILTAKNGADIKFMYELMQTLKYEVGGHERHWISKFAPLEVLITTNPTEQKKIADCLTAIDELIDAQQQKITALHAHKKGLMQNLFPQLEDDA